QRILFISARSSSSVPAFPRGRDSPKRLAKFARRNLVLVRSRFNLARYIDRPLCGVPKVVPGRSFLAIGIRAAYSDSLWPLQGPSGRSTGPFDSAWHVFWGVI